MATFRDAPVMCATWMDVHIVSNSVWERTAKFTNCGVKIGPNPQYDLDSEGNRLVPTCPRCIRQQQRNQERERQS